MESVKSLIGLEEGEPERSRNNNESFDFEGMLPSLSFKQRLWGFGICIACGIALGFISSFVLFVNITLFAILYTLGNILSVLSTGFLVGPVRQIKSMFEKKRLVATIVFITAMALTLFVAFYIPNEKKGLRTGLVIILLVFQWIALIWYSLSYIPFARRLVRSCVGGICRKCSI